MGIEWKPGGTKSPNEILGVSSGAPLDEIKKAFRALIIKHHPDRNPGDPTAAGRTQEISEAYEVLTSSTASKPTGSRPETPNKEAVLARMEAAEQALYTALGQTPRAYRSCVEKICTSGFTQDQLTRIFWTTKLHERTAELILELVVGFPIDTPEIQLEQLIAWVAAGVKIREFIALPAIASAIEQRLVQLVNDDKTDLLARTVPVWKAVDVPVANILRSQEIKRILERKAIDILDRNGEDPTPLLSYLSPWKAAGIETDKVFESRSIQRTLTDRAKELLTTHPQDTTFRTFMERWMKAGWKPAPDLLQALK